MEWYDLFKKLQNISEAFAKGKEMVHEDMPEDFRQAVRGVLYHLEPAKILRVERRKKMTFDPERSDDIDTWDVSIHTYQVVSIGDAEEYFDDLLVKQLHLNKLNHTYDREWPSYYLFGESVQLGIYFTYDQPESDEKDFPEEDPDADPYGNEPKGTSAGRRDDDPEDWWKKGSDKFDPDSWKK
jgi:hypothetical protein